MRFRRLDARRFSTAESFRLFIEGIRGLQLYEDEAAKGDDGPATQFPDQSTLEQSLQSAYQNLNECVLQYPADLLPHYYLGIVLTLKAQESQAIELQQVVSQGSRKLANTSSDKFLHRAVTEFQNVIAFARGQLRFYAEYNSAQALARLDSPADWDAALKTLSGMDLDSPDLDLLPRWKRVACRIVLSIGEQEKMLTNFAGHLFRQIDGEQGVLASAARVRAEQIALTLQTDLLKSFVISRYYASSSSSEQNSFTVPASKSGEKASQDAITRLNGFLQRIHDSGVSDEAIGDMEADYWNKTSFLLWEQSSDPSNAQNRDVILQQAETCASRALELKGRKNWTPAELNLARVFFAQERHNECSTVLKKILGAQIPKEAAPTIMKQDPDPAIISDLIIKMAPTNDANAITQIILSAWGKLDRSVLQNILLSLAGRIESAILRQIAQQL